MNVPEANSAPEKFDNIKTQLLNQYAANDLVIQLDFHHEAGGVEVASTTISDSPTLTQKIRSLLPGQDIVKPTRKDVEYIIEISTKYTPEGRTLLAQIWTDAKDIAQEAGFSTDNTFRAESGILVLESEIETYFSTLELTEN